MPTHGQNLFQWQGIVSEMPRKSVLGPKTSDLVAQPMSPFLVHVIDPLEGHKTQVIIITTRQHTCTSVQESGTIFMASANKPYMLDSLIKESFCMNELLWFE